MKLLEEATEEEAEEVVDVKDEVQGKLEPKGIWSSLSSMLEFCAQLGSEQKSIII